MKNKKIKVSIVKTYYMKGVAGYALAASFLLLGLVLLFLYFKFIWGTLCIGLAVIFACVGYSYMATLAEHSDAMQEIDEISVKINELIDAENGIYNSDEVQAEHEEDENKPEYIEDENEEIG